MWTLHDYTKKTGGYLSIHKDGRRVADVFPFAKGEDGPWIRQQAARIVEQMNRADAMLQTPAGGAASGVFTCSNPIPLPGSEH